jgi:hypothetical protein
MIKKGVVLILVCLSIVQGVSGFSVLSLTTDPSGDIRAGDPVTVSFIVSPANMSRDNFLVITTDLKNPVWKWRTRMNNQDSPHAAVYEDYFKISGYSYTPGSSGNAVFPVDLTGSVPLKPSANQHLLEIKETDSKGEVVAGSPGYSLPVSVKTTPEPARTSDDTITDITASAGMIVQDENTENKPDTSTGSNILNPKEAASPLRTTGPGNPPAPESPVDPLEIIGVVGIAFLVMKK